MLGLARSRLFPEGNGRSWRPSSVNLHPQDLTRLSLCVPLEVIFVENRVPPTESSCPKTREETMVRLPIVSAVLFSLIVVCAAFSPMPIPANSCTLQVRDVGAGIEMRCNLAPSCNTPGFTCSAGADANMNPGHIMHFCDCDLGGPANFSCVGNSLKCETMVAESTGDDVTKIVLCYDCDCGPLSGLETSGTKDCKKYAVTATWDVKCSCP